MTSTVISEAVKAGKLKIVGAYYELQTGKITLVT
jgi:carbonic anhydrase